jgi:Domain of unknown function (DUF4271)
VNRFFVLLFLSILLVKTTIAQNGRDSITIPATDTISRTDTSHHRDSTLRNDSLPAVNDSLQLFKIPDSISKRPRKDMVWQMDFTAPVSIENLNRQIVQRHPYFGFANEKLLIPSDIRQFHGKELIFYLLVFLLIIYAGLRLAFPKYFNDLFRLFFRTTLKQRQIREQLMQTPLPSLLLNGFFVVSGGLYISFILQHYNLDPVDNFWLLFLYSGLGLSAIYFIKFLGLKFTGWLFNIEETANSYIFIIFVINKMLGLFLLPFLILLAFTQGTLYPVALTLSFCMIAGLVAYRFILSYTAIRNQVRVNPFHFFLYLVAVEIAPLLLIYKGLLLFFRITA